VTVNGIETWLRNRYSRSTPAGQSRHRPLSCYGRRAAAFGVWCTAVSEVRWDSGTVPQRWFWAASPPRRVRSP